MTMSLEEANMTALDALEGYLRARDAFQSAIQQGLMEMEYLRCEIGHDRLKPRDCTVHESPLYTFSALFKESGADTKVSVRPKHAEEKESQRRELDRIPQEIDPTHAEQLRRIQSCFRQGTVMPPLKESICAHLTLIDSRSSVFIK
eukprot:gb/GECG01002223.1/.p1 GENE.gb/GECG01002223.1/~~gb/GECG01002223.1/.p1  ORF type:complete len:146 (+),score=9.00 gb/GECG01002223.1/:1-438(+)